VSDIVWMNVRVQLGEIDPWAHNPRQSGKRQRAALVSTLDEFGQSQPLVIGPREGDKFPLYDGHQRYHAWLATHGAGFEVDARLCSRALSETERQKYVIQHHASTVGVWSADELASWDAGLIESWTNVTQDMKDWKANIGVWDALHKSEQVVADAEPQTDRAAELLEKWVCKSGDLWTLGDNRLLIGDCTVAENVSRLMDGEKAGACVTDSPYGINREGIENDDPEGLRALFDGCLAVMPITDGVIINFQSPRLFPIWLDAVRAAGHKFERALWMYKSNDETFPWRGWIMSSEAIILSSIGKPEWVDIHPYSHDCYEYKHEEDLKSLEGIHTTVKPTVIVQDLISRIGGDVYEPFAGSGTTIIAGTNLKRRVFACEISEKYAAVILQRFADAFPSLPIHRLDAGG
jgi:DNA modification methylase